QQLVNPNTRNPGVRASIHPVQNRPISGNPSALINKQGTNPGNHNITNLICDGNLQENGRMNAEPVRTQNYKTNFPKICSNIDRPSNRNVADKNNTSLGKTDSLPKKDQSQEPAPYTVIQTYADRLRFNQSKKGVSINLTEPEITTKQGFPAVLYVKDEVVKDLASTCKFTLIGKLIYTMPRVELIRKNFILQTQLSGWSKLHTLILGMCTLTLTMS
ncbi:hypothetical protein EJD97_023853, partial [Solanum chilense]